MIFFLISGKYPYNFLSLFLPNELSDWDQLGLILKSRHGSLKWAQVEVCSSICWGAEVFQIWSFFLKKAKTLLTLRARFFQTHFDLAPAVRLLYLNSFRSSTIPKMMLWIEKSRGPGTNPRLYKIVKTPDKVEYLFYCISYQFLA